MLEHFECLDGFKGSDRQCMVVELKMYYCGEIILGFI